MAMESATLPIPSEVVLPLAGYYLVYLGHFNFWLVVIAASIGSLLGTLIDYAIGYYLGRAAILRYGRIIRLNEGNLKTAEGWFARHGSVTVLLARFVPLLRTLIAFPAGIAEMNLAKFVGYSIVGIFAWDAILIYVGVVSGQNYAAIVSALQTYFLPIEILAVLVIVVVLLFSWRRSKGKAKVST
ncbi:MAG: DedA family protein [Thaumarchaeota archaeon]|nr:DedA family protein [Nitrososphaerota archaeon]